MRNLVRDLLRHPGPTAAALLTLALGSRFGPRIKNSTAA